MLSTVVFPLCSAHFSLKLCDKGMHQLHCHRLARAPDKHCDEIKFMTVRLNRRQYSKNSNSTILCICVAESLCHVVTLHNLISRKRYFAPQEKQNQNRMDYFLDSCVDIVIALERCELLTFITPISLLLTFSYLCRLHCDLAFTHIL